jgi:diaminopropionate ammonia-lyase
VERVQNVCVAHSESRQVHCSLSNPSFVINSRVHLGPLSQGLFTNEEYDQVGQFFRDMPDDYAPTPLRYLKGLAATMGIGELSIKDESSRMGLPAFKILGVSYAIHRLIADGLIHPNSTLVCATDGNHGRALAHIARLHGLGARVFIHQGAADARVQAIVDEGASVTIVNGNYDASVREAVRASQAHNWTLISDTAWPGYETVPRHIMLGYTMLMAEADVQWNEVPDLVIVQAGVGGLAGAVISWLAHKFSSKRPRLVCAEPESAACVLESVRAGSSKVVEGSLETVMAGLSCGTVSSLAWPVLQSGLDACVTVSDAECVSAVRQLARPVGSDPPLTAGESGACGLAALSLILFHDRLQQLRDHLGLTDDSRVFLINTEGATDPEAYRRATVPECN